MKIEQTNVLNEMTKVIVEKYNFVWDNSFSLDTIKLLFSGFAKYLGHEKNKTIVKACRNTLDNQFHFGAMVTFMPSEEDETKGSFNLVFTFDESDIPADAVVADIMDPVLNHILTQEAFSQYNMNFFSNSSQGNKKLVDHVGIALAVGADCIKEYLRENANVDPNLELDDFFTATVQTDGSKNYYAITPSAALKQYVKDDAAIEEGPEA